MDAISDTRKSRTPGVPLRPDAMPLLARSLSPAYVRTLQATYGNKLVARLLRDAGTSRASASIPVSIQRYQAGETGHGGMEESGLQAAGFSARDAGEVYFGNWLRDMSQMPEALFPIVDIISLGEFNRHASRELLGTYVPSEHMDNPAGGTSVESAGGSSPGMSGSQRAMQAELRRNDAAIQAASLASGLPTYIERSKLFAKRSIERAIQDGRTRNSRMLLGGGLHAVEDYFSHSNFTESAILLLSLEQGGDPVIQSMISRMGGTAFGATMLSEGGQSAEIITGSYAAGGNERVSLLENLKAEIRHGSLTRAFVKGALRKAGLENELDIILRGYAAPALAWVRNMLENSPLERILSWLADLGISIGTEALDALDRAIDSAVRDATRQAAAEAPAGTVSHSELAKDAPDHPIFTLSAALAREAVRGIGVAVRTQWRGPSRDPSEAVALVDKYVCHPQADDWWRPILRRAARSR